MSDTNPARFIRLPEVARLTGFSKSTIYQRARDDSAFPKPVKIGRRLTAWRADEVSVWIEARTATFRGGSK